MRGTPEAREFVNMPEAGGVKTAIQRGDGFGDYLKALVEEQP
ncbi:MAG: hypothetical protein ACJAXW_004089 [Candidatus Azotimanducaceae bacterium]|jgi:hypothetical protein